MLDEVPLIEQTRVQLHMWRTRIDEENLHPTAPLSDALETASQKMLAQFNSRFTVATFDDRNAANPQKFVAFAY